MKFAFLPLLIIGLFLSISACNTSRETTCIDSTKINKEALCAEIYEPVCGCNNVTYGNACRAMNEGVTSYTKGECNQNKTK
jgi:NAD(P)H-nitrite reductase large subunit